jgi:hypothetical protein
MQMYPRKAVLCRATFAEEISCVRHVITMSGATRCCGVAVYARCAGCSLASSMIGASGDAQFS